MRQQNRPRISCLLMRRLTTSALAVSPRQRKPPFVPYCKLEPSLCWLSSLGGSDCAALWLLAHLSLTRLRPLKPDRVARNGT
jgi:hypothetical protein